MHLVELEAPRREQDATSLNTLIHSTTATETDTHKGPPTDPATAQPSAATDFESVGDRTKLTSAARCGADETAAAARETPDAERSAYQSGMAPRSLRSTDRTLLQSAEVSGGHLEVSGIPSLAADTAAPKSSHCTALLPSTAVEEPLSVQEPPQQQSTEQQSAGKSKLTRLREARVKVEHSNAARGMRSSADGSVEDQTAPDSATEGSVEDQTAPDSGGVPAAPNGCGWVRPKRTAREEEKKVYKVKGFSADTMYACVCDVRVCAMYVCHVRHVCVS